MRRLFSTVPAILLLALMVAQPFPEPCLAGEHSVLLAAGYHQYPDSPYLKEMDRYVNTAKLNGPSFQMGYGYRFTPHFAGYFNATYSFVDYTYRKDGGAFRVEYDNFAFLFTAQARILPDNWWSPILGGGVGIHVHQSELDLNTKGENIYAGNTYDSALGVHAQAGVEFRIVRWLHAFIEDRYTFAPMVEYAQMKQTFDVGGNTIQAGIRFSLSGRQSTP